MNSSKRKLIKYLIGIGAISGVSAFTYLKFKPIQINSSSPPHLVIAGLGSYGIALSNYLRRFVDNIKITVIDNNPIYVDRFSQSDFLSKGLVVSKTKSKEEMLKLNYQANGQFTWFDDVIIATDASTNRIQTKKNGIIKYDALVVATGLSNKLEPSLDLKDETIGSFYFDNQTSQKTFVAIRDTIRADGKILFYYPNNLTASNSYFFENLLLGEFLINSYLSGQIELHTPRNKLHSIKHFDDKLEKILNRFKQVSIKKQSSFVKIDNENGQAVFSKNGISKGLDYDFLCFAPEAKVAEFLKQDLLLNSKLIPVDKYTLQHQKYKNVFALGDIADIPVEKSLSSISEQVSTVAKNLIDLFNGAPLSARYNGYNVFSLRAAKNLGYYWERNYRTINQNNFYIIKDNSYSSSQQRIALESVTQAKYRLALFGFLV